MDRRLVRISKLLSLALRHKPQAIGITLDAAGWAEVDVLLAAVSRSGLPLDRDLLERVVQENDKHRFSFSNDGNRIRANQGHSIAVDLDLQPVVPPETLFHGTASRFLRSIQEKGLMRGSRRHVHLSQDEATAIQVGRRHGSPVVLKVRAGEMQRQDHSFFLSANQVWLTEHVPVEFIDFQE